ncbi:MAG: class I SAM-dependent methyltransferase [Candidatus Micrarchaeota archaeon]|nr:class I SAM-dependent methyltransferase [Candidatus Micrarchaeota archaeon]
MAEYYDVLELNADWFYAKSNLFINSVLKRHKVKSVVDFTCGTGAQVLYLSKFYNVTASDLSRPMLKIAKAKARGQKTSIRFKHGNVMHVRLGRFDAALTVFNAIGHLNKNQFEVALKNISSNLKDNGIYIFDIFNSDYTKWALRYKFIDAAVRNQNNTIVRFNRNYLDKRRDILKVTQETWIQKKFDRPQVIRSSWDMKVYSLREIDSLLKRNGFRILRAYGGWGKRFSKANSLSMVVVAQKQRKAVGNA